MKIIKPNKTRKEDNIDRKKTNSSLGDSHSRELDQNLKMKVVTSGYQLDLHIHSVYSKGKDRGKVAYNTLNHISVLADKLNEKGVQLCAITDHDEFGCDMYYALKQYESITNNSIIKVFPGIEFSVEFKGSPKNVVVHVIAIFDDTDDKKIARLSNCLKDDSGKTAYDAGMAFTEEKFLSILRDINLDTILIPHQKGTLTSKTKKKSDVNTVGTERFKEFIYTDFFEAFEFKNKRNEIFNKSFIFSQHMQEELRFITGSDCHDWRYYPKESKKDISEFKYTYVKCLPTFRGLVMAVTDYRRIKTVNSFFNVAETYIPKIELSINGNQEDIPLSRGINVIIGDNSIGKSLLLHKLTNYTKKQHGLLKTKVVDSYNRYLRENGIKINTTLTEDQIFGFDMQGEVRNKFEQEKVKSDEFLRGYYPAAISPAPYLEKIKRELKKVYGYLEEKFDIETLENDLTGFQLIDNDAGQAESLTFIGSVSRNNKTVENLEDIGSEIQNIEEKINSLISNTLVEDEDRKLLQKSIQILEKICKKYASKAQVVSNENLKIGAFQYILSKFKQEYQTSISDTQKKISAYNEHMEFATNLMSDIIVRKIKNKKPQIALENEQIEIRTNHVYDYDFNSRLNTTEIGKQYVKELLTSVLKKDDSRNILEITQEKLANALPYYENGPTGALEEYKKKISAKLTEDFAEKYTITQRGMDRTKELSAGFNAKIYFDLLSYETNRSGVYIIDQPEDNISQKAIREYLLERFKTMGEHRQVIIVTHNPQFIVNLDVDNVIYIGKTDNGIIIKSGALEYRDENYSILHLISDNIEGGLDTLKRRWKRYEKSNQI